MEHVKDLSAGSPTTIDWASGIVGPVSLGGSAKVFREVVAAVRLGQQEGAIPERRDMPSGSDAVFYVLDDNGGLKGFATFHDVGFGRTWLDILWVRKDCRRMGLGTALVLKVKAYAIENGMGDQLAFGTSITNRQMTTLAAKLNATPDAILYSIPLTKEPAAS